MRGGLGSDKSSIVIDPPKMGGVVKLIFCFKNILNEQTIKHEIWHK